MNPELLGLLACPLTGGALRQEAFETVGGTIDSGVLVSDAAEFPIVAGIPILKSGQGELIGLLRQGKRDLALGVACAASRYLPWLETLMKSSAIGRKLRRFSRGFETRTRENWLAWMGREIAQTPTAEGLFEFYYRKSSGDSPEPFYYNSCRFGTPGQFVALSFASALGQREGFVLDHSSGAGHLTWGLADAVAPAHVVCQDVSFFSLYVAKRVVVPRQWFVCSDIVRLPFRDGAFSAVFNSDAFTNFSSKKAAFDEMVRVSEPEAAILLVWLRNKNRDHLYPNKPLRPETYCALVSGFQHRLYADLDVLQRFVSDDGRAAVAKNSREAEQSLTISLWVEKGAAGFVRGGDPGVGAVPREQVVVNPIYRKNGTGYRLHFPTTFYRDEDREMKYYYPESFELTEMQQSAIQRDPSSESLTSLLRVGALVGVPQHYLATA